MRHQKRFGAAILVPLLLAALAWPAAAAGEASHYPGQDCRNCHKLRGKKGERSTGTSAPGSGAATGKGAAAPQAGPSPSKGASPAR